MEIVSENKREGEREAWMLMGTPVEDKSFKSSTSQISNFPPFKPSNVSMGSFILKKYFLCQKIAEK